MGKTQKKWKSPVFRPEIPDSSCELRRRFADLLNKGEMKYPALTRKIFEAGMAAVSNGELAAEAGK